MLRGGSLFYALSIAVILGLVSTSLLLAAHFGRLHVQHDEQSERVIRNARSGIELLLDEPSTVEFGMPAEIDLFGRGQDSVRLEKKAWGAFEIVIARAHHRSLDRQFIAFAGWQADETDHTALTLADLDRPLSVAGSTRLRGTCFLPKAGIQRAYIEGQGYAGDKLVYGETRTSERFLPGCNDTLVDRIKRLFDFHPGAGDAVMYAPEYSETDSIGNSFLEEVLTIYDDNTIRVSDKKICGHVCIIAGKTIYVEKNAFLGQVLLIAPKIVIADGVEGEFQAFARDSLITGEKVRLRYPSVLGVIGTDKSPDFAALVFGKESTLTGQLFACSSARDFRKHVVVITEKETKICGQVYSSDLVDHRGTVNGDIVCVKFVLKTNSAEYENHLLNAVIDRPARPVAFAASALTRKKTDRKTIVQWLSEN